MMLETFSFPVALADIADGASDIRVDMPAALLPDLARAFEILSVESVTGTFTFDEAGGGDIDLAGEVVAEVTQRCVVTLEPVANVVRERVEIRFVPGPAANTDEVGSAIADDHDAADDVMPLEGDSIDLAPIMIETVALGLDPYPRAPGAAFDGVTTDRDARKESPFAALEKLKSDSES